MCSLGSTRIMCQCAASSQLQVISTENSQPFLNPDRITVGLWSDFVLQVRRINQNATLGEEEGGDIRWRYRAYGSEVDEGLRPFGREWGVESVSSQSTERSRCNVPVQ